ncbi:MAG: site-specific DNA-methyltransferase [Desulfobacterales bacterium]|nr:site-specific DNA-methyltransferase [Desulfobacterales bacterium]
MKTDHRLFFADSKKMKAVADQSIDLVVTSPPYPMIEMWDDTFAAQSQKVAAALKDQNRDQAFEMMHQVLDKVWNEVVRILKPGGFACINIGDATRTIGSRFMLYPNHARILSYLYGKGLCPLPAVLWRKQTNAPNKFMGSGMLPAGAYVTLEHEYVLILRKGDKREFDIPSEKADRRRSALFWEERNQWFSDVWMDLKGARQAMQDKKVRERSGAFPFELAYRLINMYSVAGDTVLDPFLGAGTTMIAAMVAARNSIGFELESEFVEEIRRTVDQMVPFGNQVITDRLARHRDFVKDRLASGKAIKHESSAYGFPVVTNQEKEIFFHRPQQVDSEGRDRFAVSYKTAPLEDDMYQPAKTAEPIAEPAAETAEPKSPKQQELF